MRHSGETPIFFRRFAHDLQNVLAGVRGAVEILASRAMEGPDAEFARAAIADLERADALIHNAAAYVAPAPLDIRSVELGRLVDEALQQVAPVARSLEVHINLARRDKVTIPADIDQLARAVGEVVRNAIESSPKSAEVRLTATADGAAGAVIEVQEAGRTTPSLDARAFAPLVSTKRGHAGLGLSIAKQVVEAHGGTIELDGTGHGTIVRIRLPRREPEAIDSRSRVERS